LIGDSDINFYGIFSKLATVDVVFYLLIGSCGSSDLSDMAKTFMVQLAVKGDRGKLDQNQKFVWDPTKKVECEHKLWGTEIHALGSRGINPKKTCSTNFLNTNVIDEVFTNGYLFDMETFDFFDICKKKGIKRYSCVRFVTDYVHPLSEKYDNQSYITKVCSIQEFKKEMPSNPDQFKIEDLKKLLRLKLHVNFDFVFSLNLMDNQIVSGVITYDSLDLEKFYSYFSGEYLKKIQAVDSTYRGFTGNALQENYSKWERLRELLAQQQAVELQRQVSTVAKNFGAQPSFTPVPLQQPPPPQQALKQQNSSAEEVTLGEVVKQGDEVQTGEHPKPLMPIH